MPGILNNDSHSPIRVDKSKCRRRLKNVFIDDRGFPDISDAYDTLLHNIDGGPVLRKLKHPPPQVDVVDHSFAFQYDENLHGTILRERLDLSHLNRGLQDTIYAMIRKYWAVFDDRGVFVPVRNYECVIDTGDCPGIAIKKIRYGAKEIPLMRKAVAGLEKVGHIRQVHDGRWLFKAVLAPKPHQEHVRHINDFASTSFHSMLSLRSLLTQFHAATLQCLRNLVQVFGCGFTTHLLVTISWPFHRQARKSSPSKVLMR